MRTIAIGDIHGCRNSLEALAEEAEFSESDTIVTLGDYVDRGPDSKGAIDFILNLRERMKVVSLMGNHEVIMLDARQDRAMRSSWLGAGVGGAATMDSYGAQSFDDIPAEHWDFIGGGKLFYEIDTHFFVHANALSDVPLAEQPDHGLLWARFYNPPPHENGKVMVCGHTSQRSGVPVNLGHAICIDTWACGDGWLTGLDVASGHYWQTNEKGGRREGEIADLLDAT